MKNAKQKEDKAFPVFVQIAVVLFVGLAIYYALSISKERAQEEHNSVVHEKGFVTEGKSIPRVETHKKQPRLVPCKEIRGGQDLPPNQKKEVPCAEK